GRDEDHHPAEGRRHRRAGGRAERAERAGGGRPRGGDGPRHRRPRGPGACAAPRRGAAHAPARRVTAMATPLLHVDGLTKRYTRGVIRPEVTFSLAADFTVDGPGVVGVMGPNGSGKTTLFELITGGNRPTSGRVRVNGQDIHAVRYDERDRLAMHYHQSYQLRSFKRTRPAFMMERASTQSPLIHLFDEPQFNTQDGYIGFMLDFF